MHRLLVLLVAIAASAALLASSCAAPASPPSSAGATVAPAMRATVAPAIRATAAPAAASAGAAPTPCKLSGPPVRFWGYGQESVESQALAGLAKDFQTSCGVAVDLVIISK